jgi:hypothetical protein
MFKYKNIQILKMFNLKIVQFKNCSNFKMFGILKLFKFKNIQIFRSSNKASRKNREKTPQKTEKSVQHKQKKHS